MSESENDDLEFLAREAGLDRANLMKFFLRSGIRQMKMDLAVKAYAEERASLSRADAGPLILLESPPKGPGDFQSGNRTFG